MLRYPFPFFDRFRSRNEICQLMHAVVSALRSLRFNRGAEAQVARTILRAMQQVIDFLQVCGTALQLVLDHTASPSVGGGVSHCTRNTFQLGELVDVVSKRQLEWIEFDRVPALEVAVSIAKSPDECPIAELFDLQQCCGYDVQRVRQLHVNVRLTLRSHILPSTSATCEPVRAVGTLLASCRAYRRQGGPRFPASCRGRAPTAR